MTLSILLFRRNPSGLGVFHVSLSNIKPADHVRPTMH